MRLHPRIALLLAFLVTLAGMVASARAQDEPATQHDPATQDDPATPTTLEALMQAAQDSTARAAADSAAAATAAPVLPPAPPWYAPLLPIVDGRVESNVARVVYSAGIEAPVGEFVDLGGRVRYGRTNTSYRQFDREVDASTFSFVLSGPVSDWAAFDIDVTRNTSYDENRDANVLTNEPLVLEHDIRELHASVTGDRDLGRGMRAHWGFRGDVEDVDRTDRGVANDRSLAGGAVGAAWGTRGPWHDFSARYGYDRRSGERTLLDLTDDAVTERDTLWARGNVDFGARLNLDLDLRRTTFVEDRLDFARNADGLVDTLTTAEPVGDEHESTWENRVDVDLRARPLPRLALNAGATSSYSESDHTFSREGLVQLGTDEFDAEGILRYAEAGSLKVRMSYSNRYNDRRSRGSTAFRGEESRVAKQANAQFRQRLTPILDLHLDLQETLDQNVYEQVSNLNDRDRLVDRSDLKLLADPWHWMQVEVAGAYNREQSINIDADRVGSSQNSDLFEVRSNLVIDPDGGWRFIQNYRLQIRLIDVREGIDEDRFNKQGQWDNRFEYRFSNGVMVDGQYIVDYQRNGSRDTSRPDEEIYVYGGARNDHRVTTGIRVPVAGFDFEARTERGFLRDYSALLPRIEDRGKVTAGVRGNWPFWRNRAKLTLNASRVLQFGPRVRDEQKDYWIVNTSLRVAF